MESELLDPTEQYMIFGACLDRFRQIEQTSIDMIRMFHDLTSGPNPPVKIVVSNQVAMGFFLGSIAELRGALTGEFPEQQ